MQIFNISPTSFFLLFGYVVRNGLKMIWQQKSFLLQFCPRQAIIFPRYIGILVRHNFLGVPTKCLMYRQHLSKKWPFQHLKTPKISRSLRSLVYMLLYIPGLEIQREPFSLLYNIICNVRYYKDM